MDERYDELEDDSPGAERPRDEGGFGHRVIPDIVRRALMTGVGTVLLGQEGVRTAIGDMKLPKEAMDYLVAQADRTKREVISSLARELRGFLDGLELQEMIQSALVGTTVEIQTTVRIVQSDEGKVGAKILDKRTQMTRATVGEDSAARPARKKKGRAKKVPGSSS